ncbi:hypothetical protein [Egbenema bharatensis]|uniref:hypothetical protein n=1 Tax=Egbenema bharatensis TaxID=3463334 RepID=UPI003A8433B2
MPARETTCNSKIGTYPDPENRSIVCIQAGWTGQARCPPHKSGGWTGRARCPPHKSGESFILTPNGA